ncbi:hypothetical protein BDV98DRAFT_627499 [Pterulicium gracile]|uniref:Uncharacterized protein n=1 Tax=Pterulicium gracile TaxID=1884261 RepID=A0A5C3QKX8_9AGAR|nr:hypothetical protein BDV98DRAFT_627499 [Pterula gracilis]
MKSASFAGNEGFKVERMTNMRLLVSVLTFALSSATWKNARPVTSCKRGNLGTSAFAPMDGKESSSSINRRPSSNIMKIRLDLTRASSLGQLAADNIYSSEIVEILKLSLYLRLVGSVLTPLTHPRDLCQGVILLI